MTQATYRKINKTAGEIQSLVKKSKRKLLELEVMMNLAEIQAGNFDVVKDVKSFLRKVR